MLSNKNEVVSANPNIGSTVEGTVVARERSALYIDLGVFGAGIIYGREYFEAKELIKGLNVGDKVFAKITEMENDQGYRELSLKGASKDMSWNKLRDIKEKGEIVKVKVTGVNKGGLLAVLDGIAAFLPVSQLAPEHYPRVIDADKQKILRELQKFIGKTLEVKILDLLAEENKLILSEKAKAEEQTREILKNYKKGDIIDGKITGIADFGVFIKFPISDNQTNVDADNDGEAQPEKAGIEGLIHISELDWQLVENPAEVVKVGEIIKAQIIGITNSQVFLSLKSMKENPWEEVEKKFKKGDTLNAKVLKVSSFGAFVEVLPKIRGLCHVSEFESEEKMKEKLNVGQMYDFEVLLIDPKEHRMSLKLVK
jgi:small subunit ribosomal protein S1